MIPLVALGQYRHVAASMDPFLAGTQFYAAAIMDLKQEPEAVRYSASNMKTILFNLHPRPQVLVTGAAVPSDVTKESIEVWNDYVRQTGTQDTLVINVRPHHARLLAL